MSRIRNAIAGGVLAIGTLASPGHATTIDFSQYQNGTPITIVDGTAFSLSGGPSLATTPVAAGVFGNERVSLTNSSTSDYPTSAFLTAVFQNTVSSITFSFNNYGYFNRSNYLALDGTGSVVSRGDLSTVNGFEMVTVAGVGIKSLVWSNGTEGLSDWQFGVGELNYISSIASAAPEPGTWLLMIVGFGMAGSGLRRSIKKSDERFTLKVRAIAAN